MGTKKGKQEEVSSVPAVLEGIGMGVTDASAYAEDAEAGFEDVGQEDLIIPFLNILQTNSPQVDEDSTKYIDGAKKGMVINSVTEELAGGSEGVLFVPIHRVHKYVEWVPRKKGGGFVGVHDPEDPMVIDARRGSAFGAMESPQGNDLKETFYMYGLLLNRDGGYMPAVVPFASTQIRTYKRWMTTMRSVQLVGNDGRRITLPMYAHVFRLSTEPQQNAKGAWHGWNIRFAAEANPKKKLPTAADASRLAADSEIYQAAKQIRDLFVSEAFRVAYETDQSVQSEESAMEESTGTLDQGDEDEF
jgi:hypothetical protein